MSETGKQTPEPPRRKATMRLSQREMSRISLGVVIAVIGLMGFLGYRAMMGFKASHDLLIAQQNLHMLHEAFYSYAQDWDQRLPPADRWTDAISGYLASSGQPGGALASLHGPGDGRTIGYVYNELAAGYSLESGKHESQPNSKKRSTDPSQLILLIERPGAESNAHVMIPAQRNPKAVQALLQQLSFPHGSDDTKNASTVLLKADGSQRVLTRNDFKDLSGQ